MKNCPLSITHTKLMKVTNLSPREIKKLNKLKTKKDVDGIKKFFLKDGKYDLHSADFNIIKYDDYMVMFCCHAFLPKKVIVIVYENVVYEFVPKWRKEVFLGAVTKTIYYVGFTQNPKPVKIIFNLKGEEI